jgi:hypothetical protein
MEFKDVETPRVFVADDSLPQRKLQKRRLTELTPKGATSSFLISAGLHYFISQLIIYCTLSCLNVKYICVSLVIYLFLCSLFFFSFFQNLAFYTVRCGRVCSPVHAYLNYSNIYFKEYLIRNSGRLIDP